MMTPSSTPNSTFYSHHWRSGRFTQSDRQNGACGGGRARAVVNDRGGTATLSNGRFTPDTDNSKARGFFEYSRAKTCAVGVIGCVEHLERLSGECAGDSLLEVGVRAAKSGVDFDMNRFYPSGLGQFLEPCGKHGVGRLVFGIEHAYTF